MTLSPCKEKQKQVHSLPRNTRSTEATPWGVYNAELLSLKKPFHGSLAEVIQNTLTAMDPIKNHSLNK